MRLPRMSTRRWMIAVVVLALILWAGRLWSLSAAYRRMARRYEAEWLGATPILMGPRERPRIVPGPTARLLWADAMARKYRRAAWHPWRPVEPDPPPPQP